MGAEPAARQLRADRPARRLRAASRRSRSPSTSTPTASCTCPPRTRRTGKRAVDDDLRRLRAVEGRHRPDGPRRRAVRRGGRAAPRGRRDPQPGRLARLLDREVPRRERRQDPGRRQDRGAGRPRRAEEGARGRGHRARRAHRGDHQARRVQPEDGRGDVRRQPRRDGAAAGGTAAGRDRRAATTTSSTPRSSTRTDPATGTRTRPSDRRRPARRRAAARSRSADHGPGPEARRRPPLRRSTGGDAESVRDEAASATPTAEGDDDRPRRRERRARRWRRPRWPSAPLDLQRLQAEYVNYKRRVDRDRELVARERDVRGAHARCSPCSTTSTGPASTSELEGGFKAVAELARADRHRPGAGEVRRGGRRVRPRPSTRR